MAEETWPLVWLAELAGISRGVARGLVRDGLLPSGDLERTHAVVAKVAALCTGLPATDPERDQVAITTTDAIIKGRASEEVSLVITETTAFRVGSHDELVKELKHYDDVAVVVAPVGVWLTRLDAKADAIRAKRGAVAPSPANINPAPPAASTPDTDDLPLVEKPKTLESTEGLPEGHRFVGLRDEDGVEWAVYLAPFIVPGDQKPTGMREYRVRLETSSTGSAA